MEKNNFKIWTWAIIIVIIIIIATIILFVFQNKQINSPATTNNPKVTDTTNNETTTKEPESIQDTSTQNTKTPAAATSISYADALIKYADRRIQLDKACQAHPSSVTYKDNTGIMIDNRSPQTRTIKIGTTFTIKPYGFKIIVLPDIYLKSKTILVDCDQSQNVATILIQE